MTALSLAVGALRLWTRLYTWRLAPTLAADRLAELECDVWEMQQDAQFGRGYRGARTILARLVEGMFDDLAWRMEQGPIEEQLIVRRALAVVVAGAIVIGLWAVPAFGVGGMRSVTACADEAPPPEATVDVRFELDRCTGAFFLTRVSSR